MYVVIVTPASRRERLLLVRREPAAPHCHFGARADLTALCRMCCQLFPGICHDTLPSTLEQRCSRHGAS